MKAEQAWQAALGQLQMEMPKAAFDTWVRGAELIAYEDGSFLIGVQNAYARDWLQSRLASTLTRILTGIMNRTVEVRFSIWQKPNESVELKTVAAAIAAPILAVETQTQNPTLNPRYTFENFVVGASNRLAHAASQAVAEKPAQAYNPLFLYGGVGLGKTHLLHAIGNQCSQSGLQVLYVSSEEFTNDLINAIRSHTTQAFRDKYRSTDVLLIDDIQFIAGKESTQEEFFHTFNTLHGQNKQIVISSDRPPKAMLTLEERLLSRFELGPHRRHSAAGYRDPPRHPARQDRALWHPPPRGHHGDHRPAGTVEHSRAGRRSHPRHGFRRPERPALHPPVGRIRPGRPAPPPRRSQTRRSPAPRRRGLRSHYRAHPRSGPLREVTQPRQVAMYLLREEARLSLPADR